IEDLVIPFLYGQQYYSLYGSWPWTECSHGSLGILESFFRLNDSKKRGECLDILKNQMDWNKIRLLLLKKGNINGHISCLCNSGKMFRNCHIEAWKGLVELKKSVKSYKHLVPKANYRQL